MRTSLSSAEIIKLPSSSFIFPFSYSSVLSIGAEARKGAPPTVCNGVDPVLLREEGEQGQAEVALPRGLAPERGPL